MKEDDFRNTRNRNQIRWKEINVCLPHSSVAMVLFQGTMSALSVMLASPFFQLPDNAFFLGGAAETSSSSSSAAVAEPPLLSSGFERAGLSTVFFQLGVDVVLAHLGFNLWPGCAHSFSVRMRPLGRRCNGLLYPHHVKDDRKSQEAQDQAAAEQDASNQALWNKLQEVELNDYYGLLDLADKRFNVNEDEVRRKYKVISLLLHPDKAPTEIRDEAEARFKAMQKGTSGGREASARTAARFSAWS